MTLVVTSECHYLYNIHSKTKVGRAQEKAKVLFENERRAHTHETSKGFIRSLNYGALEFLSPSQSSGAGEGTRGRGNRSTSCMR
jgi:hypothetical protein